MPQGHGSRLAVGFLIGVVVGAAVGLLFASQSGKDAQDWIGNNAKNGFDNLKTASQRVKETVQSVSEQGRTQVAAAVEAGE